jgi:hypothetical protein
MHSRNLIATALVVTAASTALGCAAPATDEAERFREALPIQDEIALRVPGGASATTKTAGLHVASGPGLGAAGSDARFYQLTRDMTATVDHGTAVIFGAIWALVHSPPTTREAKKAVWGPGSSTALEPALWRFTASRVRSRTSTSSAAGRRTGADGRTSR